jgi:hypothetical protein
MGNLHCQCARDNLRHPLNEGSEREGGLNRLSTNSTPTLYGGQIVNGIFQSAVQEYRHPGDRSILLIGLAHVAEPEYFATIRAITDQEEKDGATVLFEGVRGHTECREMSDEERLAIATQDQVLNAQNRDILSLFDLPWIEQDESVLAPCFTRWERADANELDMIRLLGPRNAAKVSSQAALLEHYRQLKETKGADSAEFKLAKAQVVAGKTGLGFSADVARERSNGHQDQSGNRWMLPYVFTYRECVAALRTLETPGNVVLLWHPGHMIHIGQIFVRNGFVPSEDVLWLTVFRGVEPLSVT